MRIVRLILLVLFFVTAPAVISPDINTQIIVVRKQIINREIDTTTARHETSREMIVEATAYSYTGSRTFTGTWPKRGTVAVDPAVIPLGSTLYIEGYGWGRAEDTGGLIKGNRIDVFFENESDAWKWGRKVIRVRIEE